MNKLLKPLFNSPNKGEEGDSVSGRPRKLSEGDAYASDTPSIAAAAAGSRKYRTLHRLPSHANKESMRDLAVSFTARGELLGLEVALEIPYTQVGATKTGKIYTQYVIRCELPPPKGSAPNTPSKEWTVRKRYSAFVDLDKQLKTKFANSKTHLGGVSKLASLPPKRIFAQFEDHVIIERKKGLAQYLQSALKACGENNEASLILARFLEMPGSAPLAAKSANQQEEDEDDEQVGGGGGVYGEERGGTSNVTVEKGSANIVTTVDGTEAHHGFLYKRGGMYQQKPFKLSFCVLNFEEAVFRFYRTSRPQLLGAVQLKGQKDAYVRPLGKGEMGIPDNGFGFSLFTPERELIMYAETKEDRDSWINALQRCLPSQPSKQASPPAKETPSAKDHVAERGSKPAPRVSLKPVPPPEPASQTPAVKDNPKMVTPIQHAERELEFISSIKEDWAIDWDDLEILEKVGGGAFGTVYKGRCWGSVVAVKQLNTNGELSKELKLAMEKEVGVLSKLRHPNVVLYLGASFTASNAAMITEWCENKSLFDLLQNMSRIRPSDVSARMIIKYALQVARGMCYLHSRKERVIHRDLKSLNVLITEGFDAKVADFGLTVMREATASSHKDGAPLQQIRTGRFDSQRSQPSPSVLSNSGAEFFGIEGTAQWMAPEVMEGARYNFKVDVYSFGILLTELLTRKMPYKDLYGGFDFVDAVVDRAEIPTIPHWASLPVIVGDEGERSSNNGSSASSSRPASGVPGASPSMLGELVVKCTSRDPAQRPDFRHVIAQLEELEQSATEADLFFKFDLPRLREMLDAGDWEDVIQASLEFLTVARKIKTKTGLETGPANEKALFIKFVGSCNIIPAILSRLSVGIGRKVVERGGDYTDEPFPVETLVDLVSILRCLAEILPDPTVVYQQLYMPKKDPLEAIMALFLRFDLDEVGIEACGGLLNDFRACSTKFRGAFDEAFEAKLDHALEDKRNPLMAVMNNAQALRRRTVVVSDKEQVLWRCKSYDLLPNKHAKRGVIGSAREDIAKLENEIRNLERQLQAKRRELLETMRKDVSKDVGKV